jgi:cysteine dioxygenase
MAAVSTRFAPLPLMQPQTSCRATSSFQNIENPNVYSLDDFVRDIKEHLGESGGIGCDEVDEDYLISLARKYMSNPNDWARYYHNCPGKNYTRNAIVNINQKANIVCSTQFPAAESC